MEFYWRTCFILLLCAPKAWGATSFVQPRFLEDDVAWPAVVEAMDQTEATIDARFLRSSPKPTWVHFTAENPGSQPQAMVLVHPFALTSRIELYTKDAQGLHALGAFGDSVAPLPARLWHRTPAIAMELQPGVTHFYLLVSPNNPQALLFTLYTDREFHAMHARDLAILCTLIGIIVVMLLYNTFIYLSLRYDYYLYYLGFGAVYYLSYTFVSGLPRALFFLDVEIPNLSVHLAAGVGSFSFFFICRFVNSFLRVEKYFPRQSRFTHKASYVAFLLLPMVVLEGLFSNTTYSAKVVNAFAAVNGCWIFYLGVRTALRRYPPALHFLIAFTTLVLGNTYSNLVIDGHLPLTEIFYYSALMGGCLEIVLLSISLGQRVKAEDEASRRKIQELADVLDQRVEERTRFARSILNNISVGLLRIEAHGRVASDHSRSALELFQVDQLDETYIWDLLHYPSDSENRSVLQNLLEVTIGEDVVNLLANEEHFPRLYEEQTQAGRRLIELNWSPFLHDQTVEAMLLLARDVTYIRNLESEHQKRADEADFIMTVARHGVGKMRQYLEDEAQSVRQVLELLARFEQKKAEILRLLHTMKGNTRTMGLADLARLIHHIEDELTHKKMPDVTLHLAQLNETFIQYREKVEHYFPAETQRITAPLQALERHVESLAKRPDMQRTAQDMRWIIASMQNSPLMDLATPLQTSARELALHLHKPEPLLEFAAADILVSSRLLHRLRSILIHLLRNALDHGIEAAAQRAAAHKAEAGRITIDFREAKDRMIIRFADDGGGLQLQKVWNKAVAQGLFPSDQVLRVGDVAELIFQSGFTSKEAASQISGRGIGLDAVRDLCRELQGTIRLTSAADLNAVFDSTMNHMAIAFEIQLPLELFVLRDRSLVSAA